MNSFNFSYGKHRRLSNVRPEVQYLVLNSEPTENAEAARVSFNYHNRYLAKRRVMRNVRRLRRGQMS